MPAASPRSAPARHARDGPAETGTPKRGPRRWGGHPTSWSTTRRSNRPTPRVPSPTAPTRRNDVRIILRADVDGLGKRGDIVEVAAGYGRNYLLPKQLAFLATPGAVDQAAKMRRS